MISGYDDLTSSPRAAILGTLLKGGEEEEREPRRNDGDGDDDVYGEDEDTEDVEDEERDEGAEEGVRRSGEEEEEEEELLDIVVDIRGTQQQPYHVDGEDMSAQPTSLAQILVLGCSKVFFLHYCNSCPGMLTLRK